MALISTWRSPGLLVTVSEHPLSGSEGARLLHGRESALRLPPADPLQLQLRRLVLGVAEHLDDIAVRIGQQREARTGLGNVHRGLHNPDTRRARTRR